MLSIQFIVQRQGEKWSVRSQDLERSFGDEEAATRDAVELANHSGQNGKPAVVMVEIGNGLLETVWTYGVDAYPPSKLRLAGAGEHSVAAAGE
jgi:hypothetical protein